MSEDDENKKDIQQIVSSKIIEAVCDCTESYHEWYFTSGLLEKKIKEILEEYYKT